MLKRRYARPHGTIASALPLGAQAAAPTGPIQAPALTVPVSPTSTSRELTTSPWLLVSRSSIEVFDRQTMFDPKPARKTSDGLGWARTYLQGEGVTA